MESSRRSTCRMGAFCARFRAESCESMTARRPSQPIRTPRSGSEMRPSLPASTFPGQHVTQWSQGDYVGANNQEDDLAILASRLGRVVDDHGDSSGQATALVVEADGTIRVTSPELDPDNARPQNKGVIGSIKLFCH